LLGGCWNGIALALGCLVASLAGVAARTRPIPTGRGAAAAEWLRCWRGSEIDWPQLRVKLDSYADKYLQAPQLFTEEAQLALIYAHKPLRLPGSAACPLGDLALRLFMWLFVEEDRLSEAVEGSPAFGAPGSEHTSLQPAAMLAQALRSLWEAPLSWSDILASGWPLFSILAQLGQRARRAAGLSPSASPAGQCEDARTWGGRPYLRALEQTFETGVLLPVHASLAVVLEVDRAKCPLAFACALLSLAESARWDSTDAGLGPDGGYNAHYYRNAAMAPLLVESPNSMLGDLHEYVGREPETDREALLEQAERSLRESVERERTAGGQRGQQQQKALVWPSGFLLTPWPLWRMVDRLGCSEWVEVRTAPLAPSAMGRRLRSASPSFFIHVFPHRVSSDGMQSSKTRASEQPYCAKEFQNELDGIRLRRGPSAALRVVEAGPHLGDCLLWAAARAGCAGRLRMTGYDVIHQLVAFMRKSIDRNAMGACLDVKLAFLAEAASERTSFHGVPALSLDSQLDEHVDLLKVHTNGGEDAILRGGRSLFSDPAKGVDVVVLNSASAEVLLRAVQFLSSLPMGPYELQARGRLLEPGEEEQALREALRQGGSVQLVARRGGLPPERSTAHWNATRGAGR